MHVESIYLTPTVEGTVGGPGNKKMKKDSGAQAGYWGKGQALTIV